MKASASPNDLATGALLPRVVAGARNKGMRQARTCYDHRAGQLAVAVADRMVARGLLELLPDGAELTEPGNIFLRGIGINLDRAKAPEGRRGKGRMYCRLCVDWTERRPHLAGAVGAALCESCFRQGWLLRLEGTRAVLVTLAGRLALGRAFELPADLLFGSAVGDEIS